MEEGEAMPERERGGIWRKRTGLARSTPLRVGTGRVESHIAEICAVVDVVVKISVFAPPFAIF